MKCILCVTVFTLLIVRTKPFSDEINLFPINLIDEYSDKKPIVDETDSESPLDLSGVHTRIPMEQLSKFYEMPELMNKTVSSPYIIHIKIKLAKAVTSSIFSIEQDRLLTTMLQTEPAGPGFIRIILVLYGSDEISFDFPIEIDTWANILIYVKDEEVIMYNDCEFQDQKDVPGKKQITFSKDGYLILGKTEKYSAFEEFEGSIKELKLYTNADDNLRKTICPSKNESNIYDKLLFDTDYDTDYYSTTVEIKPENIMRGDGGSFGVTTPTPVVEKGEKGDTGVTGERGLKGEKGEKGATGLKGEPGETIKGDLGPIGLQGPEGPPGRRGEEGKCECSESVVSTLLRTMPEMRGPPGERGPIGVEGARGLTGPTGLQGLQGERGPQGLKGETGERGDDGRPGRDGEPGLNGEPGRDGASGPPGPQGIIGPPGPPGTSYVETEDDRKFREIPGEKGDLGPQGPPGPAGPTGDRGERGEKGEQGLTGEKGDQGHKGHEGPRGLKGDRGESGKDGISGIPGHHGRDGERGEKGDRGDKGSPGLSGISASITELLDPDMNPHENTQIVEKLRGFKGDMGMAGEKGVKGDQGLPGTPGESGKDGQDGERGSDGPQGPKGDIGPFGPRGHKGDTGEPGPPGLVPASAIALMKGSKGTRGPQGPRGSTGPRGYTGKQGANGKPGAKGDRGNTGPVGPLGPMGLPGYNGTTGEKGEKGECVMPTDFSSLSREKGDRGDRGLPGSPGAEGPPGKCDECNRIPTESQVGPPGPPGPSGPPGLSISGPKGEPGGIYPGFGHGIPDLENDDDVHLTSTVMFRNTEVLIKKTSKTPLGTLAYVLQENILLIRVRLGWQYVEMGSLIREPTTTQQPLFTPRPVHQEKLVDNRPPFAHYVKNNTFVIRIAALNDPYSGLIESGSKRGHSAADYLCNQSKGNFRAFLTNSILDAKSLIHEKDRQLPVANLKGELLFESWESMFNGTEAKFMQPNIYSFNMRNVLIDQHWPNKVVWHGSNSHGIRKIDNFCNEWGSNYPEDQGLASPLETGRLLGQKLFSCDNKFIVLCVEVSASKHRTPSSHQPPSSPLPRRRHYVSRSRGNNYENNVIRG